MLNFKFWPWPPPQVDCSGAASAYYCATYEGFLVVTAPWVSRKFKNYFQQWRRKKFQNRRKPSKGFSVFQSLSKICSFFLRSRDKRGVGAQCPLNTLLISSIKSSLFYEFNFFEIFPLSTAGYYQKLLSLITQMLFSFR